MMISRTFLRSVFVGLVSIVVLSASFGLTGAQAASPMAVVSGQSTTTTPILFIRTAGDTDQAALFSAYSNGKIVSIGKDQLAFDLPLTLSSDDVVICDNPSMKHSAVVTTHGRSIFQLAFDHAANSVPEGSGQIAGTAGTFATAGNFLSLWSKQALYEAVAYRALYPGVDLTFAGQDTRMNGTFNLAAGLTPSTIAWHYVKAEYVYLAPNGDLHVYGRDGGLLVVSAPIGWQTRAGVKVPVAVSYSIADDYGIQFTAPFGSYDSTLPLTIAFTPD